MKRIGIVACLAIMTGCSGFAASDKAAEPASPGAGAAEPPRGQDPAAPPLNGTPVSDELTEDFGIFVETKGVDDGDGTRARPVASIGKGIALAKAAGKRVYVCAGVYREALTLVDGISIVGGLTCDTQEWTTSDARSRVEADASPAAIARGITKPTRIDHLELVAPDATTGSGSSIGMLAVDAGGLTIAGSRIVAGNAMKGDDGAEGVKLTQTGHVDGTPGTVEKIVTIPTLPNGAAGGVSVCSGAPGHDGAAGGTAGTPGVYVARSYTHTIAGQTVTTASWEPLVPGDAIGLGVPGTGAPGAVGTSGTSATTWGTIGESGFAPADGSAGTDGAPGQGGKGGDSKMMDYPPENHIGQTMWGWGGSGGGAGGCPGLAGTAGHGGGASLALVALRSALAIEKSELVAGNGGAGGKGTFGSAPTPGGNPGTQSADGTSGTAGGAGGASGVSGSGAGGPSIALAHAGGQPSLTDSTTTIGAPGDGVPAMSAGGKTVDASAAGVAQAVVDLTGGH
jgi:hypothetical protein